jgi:predicted Zn-dependent protease
MRASVVASSLVILLLVAPAAAQRGRTEDESADLVREGRALLEDKRYGDAAEALDQAIALNPRRIEAYVLRAAIFAAKREYAAGVRLLRRAQALAPANLDVLAALGAQLYLGGETDDGAALLEQVVAREPQRYEAQALLGRYHVGHERWRDAIVAIEAYLAKRPKALASADPVHQARLAEAYLRAGRARDARALYDRVLKARPREVAARMGRAWALAAIDCKEALRALSELDDLVEAHPEILLVRGRCALSLGDAARALELGEQYLAQRRGAAGEALVGEAAAATGDLPRAIEALQTARKLEPERRRWGLKLAIVLRRAGEAGRAVEELEAMGAPDAFAADVDWWRELGEALIAADRSGEVAARLAPALSALPDDALLATIAGEASLRAGDVAGAITLLSRGGSSARARSWLGRALAADAAARIAAKDLDGAEAALARADQLDVDPTNARNLGILRLARGTGDALTPLRRAVAAGDDSVEAHLALARALAQSGDNAGARGEYEQAARKARGDAAVRVAIDLAAFEVDRGHAAEAVDVLDAAAAARKKAGPDLLAAYVDAMRTARHAAGLAALRAGNASRAARLLAEADHIADGKDETLRCDLALATVAAGDRDLARKRLRALANVKCPFPTPADTLAVPILLAYVDAADARDPERALAKLARFEGKATGPVRALLSTTTRIVAIAAAQRAYADRKYARARKLLQQAKRVAGSGDDELALDLAAVDIAEGKLDAAARALERLTRELPEALVHLGIVEDRRGDGTKAVERWVQARLAGVRFAPLDEWIAAKERVYGGAR